MINSVEALAEEVSLRAHLFWLQRSVPLSWPLDFKGFTFLGNVVDEVGRRVFGNWSGLEPAELHIPILTKAPQYTVSQSVKFFAGLLLLQLDPSAPKDLFDTMRARQRRGESPFGGRFTDMINTGKCPKCDTRVTSITIEPRLPYLTGL